MKTFILGGLTGAVLVGLILVLVLVIADVQITDADVKVPSLLDNRPLVAKAKLQAVGLKARVVTAGPSDPFGLFGSPIPHVSRQIPDAGTTVHSDATVTLFVAYR